MTRRPLSLAAVRLTSEGAVDHCRRPHREVQRRHRDAVTERDGHGVDLHPVTRPERRRDLGKLCRDRLQEADLVEEGALALRPHDVDRHLGRGDVRRILEDLGYRQRPALRVIVVDREAVDLDRRRRVEDAGHRDLARIESHRRVEDLEGRTLLVDAERRAVEQRLVGQRAGAVGIVGGQRRHGEDLAVGRVHHDRGGADGREFLDGTRDLALDDALQALAVSSVPQIDRTAGYLAVFNSSATLGRLLGVAAGGFVFAFAATFSSVFLWAAVAFALAGVCAAVAIASLRKQG